MKNIIISLLVTAISILILAYILPGVGVSGFGAAVITAIVLGLINSFIKPLFTFLTIPITIITLGIFLIFINAIMILLADKIVPGFSVDNIWWALLFGFLLGVLNSFLGESVEKLT